MRHYKRKFHCELTNCTLRGATCMVWTCRTGYKPNSKCARNSVARFKPPVPLPHDKLASGAGNPDRDGFKVRRKTFALSKNASVDPVTKRKLTVCNLFINHRLSIADVTRVLDEEYGRIVNILIEQALLHDRRKQRREPAPRSRKLRS